MVFQPRCCPYCQQAFQPSLRRPDQAVCSRPECQARRHSDYRRHKRQTDPSTPRWSATATENDFGRLRQGNFVQRLWQLQSGFALNPNLVLTSFVQYDTELQNLGTNTRLRWTLKPGNDRFIVWNRGWQRLILRPRELGLIPDNELLAVNYDGHSGTE